MNYSKLVTLIESETCEGLGTPENMCRLVRYYHQQDGTQVFKIDHIEDARLRDVATWARQLAKTYRPANSDDAQTATLAAELILKNTPK